MKNIFSIQKIHLYLCVLIAFFLPFQSHDIQLLFQTVPILTCLLIINWIAEGDFNAKISNLKSNKPLLLFISFYLLYVIGMLWSKNMNYGGIDLQIKLSLLIFPIIFGSSKYFIRIKSLKIIFIAFITGCFIATIICFSNAMYIWITQNENDFTYTKLSVFLHPSYFAMYLSFAIAIIYSILISGKTITGKSVTYIFLIIWFWFSIIMLQSKAGILITGILFIVFFFRMVSVKKKIITALVAFIVLGCIYFAVTKYIITANHSRILNAEHQLIETKLDTTTKESNQVRILIWKASADIIKNNFLIGTGTGDVKDELMRTYKEKGMTGAFEHNLNAHNQFIQTFIALGVPGIVGLLSLFISGIWSGIKKRKWVFIFFMIITLLNFIPESMLEVQTGVIFFAFFNSLLLFSEAEPI
jgi:O-antigen ligase